MTEKIIVGTKDCKKEYDELPDSDIITSNKKIRRIGISHIHIKKIK